METEETKFVKVGEDQVSLAELSGMDLSDMQEMRGMATLPEGTFHFKICVTEDGHGPGWREYGEKVAASFPLLVKDVKGLKNNKDAPEGDPTKLIGKVHTENFFMTSVDSPKYLAAFFVDVGTGKKGSIKQLFAKSVDIEFIGTIVSRKDKNDDSIVYYRLDTRPGKIIPVQSASPARAA